MKLNSSGSVNRLMPVASRAMVSFSLSVCTAYVPVSFFVVVVAVRESTTPRLRPSSARRIASMQEIGPDEIGFVFQAGVDFDGLLQHPPPALAVVLGVGERLRQW